MLKIGIIAVGYQSEYISSSLAPWIMLKCGGCDNIGNNIEPDKSLNIKICTASALFKERWDMGEAYSNDENEEILNILRKNQCIDECIFIKHPIIDFESRNYCWDYLKQFDLDLIWQLDFGDEIYSVKQIKDILAFVNKNKFVDWFKVNFKNYVGSTQTYVNGFCPPRIHWVNRNGGVDKFVWDNDLVYKNGKHANQCSNMQIPKNIAHVAHYSWCGSSDFLKKKIEYQHRCLGVCSYKWDDSKNSICFDLDFYQKNNIPIPEILHDNSV